jgi:hypothetical protein
METLFPDGGIKAKIMSPPWNSFSGFFSILLWLDLATMKDQ